MKQPFYTIFFLLFAALTMLTSCEKDDVLDNMVIPQTTITFDDNIDKITADYKVNSTLTLKISGLNTATSVQVTSRYTASGATKTKEVATLIPTNGVATLSVPVSALRNTADGAITGATTTTASRTSNTYSLIVKATLPNNITEQRIFSAIIVQ
ncbi:hypothetical protein MUN82_12925 [Hymenobacter aerilatus]|uniref:DUF1735 domain-containing protein n=1 Tax=Hymenobacter aerilatus TaxID=2932251 RepID=A0A8T9SUF1_9BACT|nr:hypothetical protein [Hymenobacter aerilatus]UOR03850.1 hypothetical protein MUN82_12925 [Hymenobacter aerilatus]